MCNRFTLKFHNKTTGDTFIKDCDAYCCPECSKRKVNRLRFALERQLKTWKFIAFWTFTINARFFPTRELHYLVLSESYTDLITYLRRNRLVQRKEFRYIRVNEMHTSSVKHKGSGINHGFMHLHTFFDTFISVSEVIKLWKICVTNVCNRYDIKYDRDFISGAYVKGLYNSFQAANYVTKYVTKNVNLKYQDRIAKKLYSKSRLVVLFEVKGKSSETQEWIVILESRFTARCLLGLNILSISPQILDYFYSPHDLPPPLVHQISDWNNKILTPEQREMKKLASDAKYSNEIHQQDWEDCTIFMSDYEWDQNYGF